MTARTVFSTFVGILYIVGFIPYILSILKGKTKPAKASWVIWTILDTITVAGMYVQGTLNGQIIGATAGAWIVVILAFMYGTKGWTKLDKLCLIGAFVGIILWKLFNNPTLAILTSGIVVFIGSIPTFVSAWKDPTKENKAGWIIFWISYIFTMVSIPKFTFDYATQPIIFFAIETIMMFLLFIKPKLMPYRH